jgi:Flp pilus assembly protein TadD
MKERTTMNRRGTGRRATAAFLCAAAIGLLSCRSMPVERAEAGRGAGVPPAGEAQAVNLAGLMALSTGDLNGAETRLRTAIAADGFHGPSHNNLGVTLMRQNRFYEAAWEFEMAAKIMTASPEPLCNLGQIYESVGRYNRAVEEYEEALERSPHDLETVENLARALIRMGARSSRLHGLLNEIVLRDSRPAWRDWARRELNRLGLE